jgi:hypothetical protein
MEHLTCKGCGKKDDISDWASPSMAHRHHHWVRSDAYGIFTGIYCDKCFENNYPYRKDRYPTMEYDGYGDYLNEQ